MAAVWIRPRRCCAREMRRQSTPNMRKKHPSCVPSAQRCPLVDSLTLTFEPCATVRRRSHGGSTGRPVSGHQCLARRCCCLARVSQHRTLTFASCCRHPKQDDEGLAFRPTTSAAARRCAHPHLPHESSPSPPYTIRHPHHPHHHLLCLAPPNRLARSQCARAGPVLVCVWEGVRPLHVCNSVSAVGHYSAFPTLPLSPSIPSLLP